MTVRTSQTYYPVGIVSRGAELPDGVAGSLEEKSDRAMTWSGVNTARSYLDMKVFGPRSVGASELNRCHITGPSEPSSLVSLQASQFFSTKVGGGSCIYLSKMHGAFSPTN